MILVRGDVILTSHDLVLAQAGATPTNVHNGYNLLHWVTSYTGPISHDFFAVRSHESGHQWQYRDHLNPLVITSDVALVMSTRDMLENPPDLNLESRNLDRVTLLAAPSNSTDESLLIYHFSVDDGTQDDLILPSDLNGFS